MSSFYDNPYAIKGKQFLDAISIVNNSGKFQSRSWLKPINDLSVVMIVLDELNLPRGYVLDAYKTGNHWGSHCELYVRKRNADLEYRHCVESDEDRMDKLFSHIGEKGQIEPELSPRAFMDDMIIKEMVPWRVSEAIPPYTEKVRFPFTKVGIWQAYLLSIADTVLPRGWHGGYGRRTYIFSDKALKGLHHEECDKLAESEDIIPTVTILDENKAEVTACYWNSWRGLCVEHVVAELKDGVINFNRPEGSTKILFAYDCGIVF